MKRLLAMLLTVCLLTGCLASAEGVTTPTDLDPMPTETPFATEMPVVTETPVVTQTPEPTVTPTAELTEAPAEEPTAEPAEEPTEAPTAEPWDESACDHANIHCAQAPVCDIPGCEHLGRDVHGLTTPLCSLGAWVLERLEAHAQNPSKTRSVRDAVIDLDKGDVTLWRSGVYAIKGGQKRAKKNDPARVTVAAGRMVVLELTEAEIGTITLQNGTLTYFRNKDVSQVRLLNVGRDTRVTFLSGGAVTIGEVVRADEREDVLRVQGGSVRMTDVKESDERRMLAFSAPDARAVTVNDKEYQADCPDEDGCFYLWLDVPAAGCQWTSEIVGDTLRVWQQAPVTDRVTDVASGEQTAAQAGRTYRLAGQLASGTRLTVGADDVTVVLDGVTAMENVIEADRAYQLVVRGGSTLSGGSAMLAHAQIVAEAPLTVTGPLGAGVRFVSGRAALDRVPTGYVTVNVTPGDRRVTLDGQTLPCVTVNGRLAAPAPADGKAYGYNLDEETVTLLLVDAADPQFTMDADGCVADAAGAQHFTVRGTGSTVQGYIVSDGGAAEMANVKLRGSELLHVTGALTVRLTGDNALCSAGGAIGLADGARLTLNAASGRLLIEGQPSLAGITLLGNIKVDPEPAQEHLCLIIRDKQGEPVPDKAMTVTVGGNRYDVTTFADGSLHLWGLGRTDGVEIAAVDGEMVYTAVAVGEETELITGLHIQKVTIADQADGSIVVDFDCEGAKTAGVQYISAKDEQEVPDVYMADALRVEGSTTHLVLRGVGRGQTVSLRVYAVNAEGASLTAQSSDGFQFGELLHWQHRVPFTLPEHVLDAAYTGNAYQPPVKLPERAALDYSGRELLRDGRPWKTGEYKLRVTIPEGDPTYLPGAYDFTFEIKKLELTIVPDPNQEKFQGDPDPETFTYTVSGHLLAGDEVTGLLGREEGEDVGNYAFVIADLTAPEYYTLRLAGGAHVFTILPSPWTGGFYGEVLHPVKQEITRADGRRVFVILNTQEELSVTRHVIGPVVRTGEDHTASFSPSLCWNSETDEVLLRLRMEPEINKDKGYATNPDGSVIWGERFLRLSWQSLRGLYQQGVDAISINNAGASLTMPLAGLFEEELLAFIDELGARTADVKFRMTVTPAAELPDALTPYEPLRAVTDAWTMRVTMSYGSEEIDVTGIIPGVTAAVDLEPVAQLLTSVELYDEEHFAEQFGLVTASGEELGLAEAAFVQPFFPEEAELAPYPCLMYGDRYLLTALTAETALCCTRLEWEEEKIQPVEPIE